MAGYLAALPPDRRAALTRLRTVIRRNLPPGYVEAFQYGAVGYVVPLRRYPVTYNGEPLPYLGFASQKQYMSLYLMCLYYDRADRKRFEAAFRKSGRRLNAGKCCIRFKSLDELPLDLVGRTVARVSVDKLIALYEASRRRSTRRP